jgi:hypothetical protein
MGTPCAYLLDADGRVAAPFAYGANEVPTLARQVAGIVELPIVKEASASDEDQDEEDLELPEIPGVKYLTSQADEVCGPGASGAKKPRIWAGTRAYAIGEYHIGVRADSPETHETLRAVFAAYRLPDDTPAPTNFSIVLGDHEGSSRGLHLLLEGNGVVVRTRSSSRVLYGLAAYLSNVIAPATSGATLRTYDRLGVVDGKAVILPGLILNDLEHVQAGLAKLGVAVADEPVTTIDLEGTEAVVPEPLVTPDAGAIEQLPEPKRWTTELPRVLPGRYPLAGWFTWTGDPEARDVSRAEAVAKAMHAAMLDPDNLVEQVDRLSDLFERVKPTGLSFEDPKGFLASLEAGLTR